MFEFFKDKRCLVTGHKGFVGTALCTKLRQHGANVHGIDQKSGCDILKKDSVYDEVLMFRPDMVFHLAAKTEVRASFTSPHETYQTNVLGTLNVLEACRVSRTPLIVASTDKVYGSSIIPGPNVCDETQFLYHNADLYAVSKRAADELCQDYARLYDMPIRILRCANIYGPGQRNETTLITSTITRLLNDDLPIVYKSSADTVREWLYIDDAVAAYLLLARDVVKHKYVLNSPPIFNVGSGERATVLETVKEILVMNGISTNEYTIRENDKPQIGDQGLNSTKFRTRFPDFSFVPLIEGLRRTIAWHKENMK